MKEIWGKINTPTTLSITAVVLVVLLQVGLIGPTSRTPAITKQDMRELLDPVVEKIEERAAQIQSTQLEIIANQKLILVELRMFSENNLRISLILQQIQEDQKEIRRGTP